MLSSVATAALRRGATRQFRPAVHFFTSGSHDDFAPKRKVVEGEDAALKMIQDHVDNNPVMLYMKGNPSMPMCEFGNRRRRRLDDILVVSLVGLFLILFDPIL